MPPATCPEVITEIQSKEINRSALVVVREESPERTKTLVLKFCISKKFLPNADATGLETTLRMTALG